MNLNSCVIQRQPPRENVLQDPRGDSRAKTVNICELKE